MKKLKVIALAIFTVAYIGTTNDSQACSTFLVTGRTSAVVAKNLDFFSGEGRILINKRHVSKTAVLIDTANPVRWISKYVTLTVTGGGREFPWEGVNEKGVSVHALELMSSEAPPPSLDLPSIGYVQWIQYILDTSADLREAIENARHVRVGAKTTLHYFACDVSGACAVFEYLDGDLKIHTQDELPFKALTNDVYDRAAAYYRSVADLPEATNLYTNWSMGSLARFARAAIWSKNITPAENSIEHAFKGLGNLAQVVPPHGSSPGWRTYWSMVFDLRAGIFYWRTPDSPAVKTVRLASFDPGCRAGVQGLDVNTPGSGEVSALFRSFGEVENHRAIDAWKNSVPKSMMPSADEVRLMKDYPSSTRCME